jgi:hypothetical protein
VAACDCVGLHLGNNACPGAMLFKFATNEDRQGALRRRKGVVGTKLGLDENLTLRAGMQIGVLVVIQRGQGGKQVHLLARNQAFINGTQICPPSSI